MDTCVHMGIPYALKMKTILTIFRLMGTNIDTNIQHIIALSWTYS